MPDTDLETEVKTTEPMGFDRALVPDTGELDTAGMTEDLRSFMDQGEEAFAGEGRSQSVIDGIRDNILARMRQENAASLADAMLVKANHQKYTDNIMLPHIENMRKLAGDAIRARIDWLMARVRASGEDAPEAHAELDRLLQRAGRYFYEATMRNYSYGSQPKTVSVTLPGMQAPLPQEAAPAGEGGPAGEAVPASAPAPAEPSAAPAQSESVTLAVEEESFDTRTQRAEDNAYLETLRRENGQFDPARRLGRFQRYRADRQVQAAREKKDTAEYMANAWLRELWGLARNWDRERLRYREGTFKKHYKAYDDHARAYYSFTRSKDWGRMLTGNEAKKIAEYVGGYDYRQIRAIQVLATEDPAARPKLTHVSAKSLSENSLNSEDRANFIKYHQTIVMNAFAEGIHTLGEEQRSGRQRVRMKLMGNFRGYRARNQFTDRTYTALTASGETAQERGKFTRAAYEASTGEAPVGMAAGEMNLTADERGVNGEYLTSEGSAELYEARIREEGPERTVRGFVYGGRFYSDESAAVTDESAASRPSALSSMVNREKMRLAIRRSDFFRHINAGTIQYYMTYDPDDDLNRAGSEHALALAGPYSPAGAALFLIRAYLAPDSIGAQALHAGHDDETLEQIREKAFAAVQRDTRDHVKHLGVMLLSTEDTALWGIARELAEKTTERYGRGALGRRLDAIPRAGQVMRIALMEEFARDRSFDAAYLRKSFMPEAIQHRGEEIMSRRAGVLSRLTVQQLFYTLFGFSSANVFRASRSYTGAPQTAAAGAPAQAAAVQAAGGQLEAMQFAAMIDGEPVDLNRAREDFVNSYSGLFGQGSGEAGSEGLPSFAREETLRHFGASSSSGKRESAPSGETLSPADYSFNALSTLYAISQFIHSIPRILDKNYQQEQNPDAAFQKKTEIEIDRLSLEATLSACTIAKGIYTIAAKKSPKETGYLLGAVGDIMRAKNAVSSLRFLHQEKNSLQGASLDMKTAMDELARRREALPYLPRDYAQNDRQAMAVAAEHNSFGAVFQERGEWRNWQDRNAARTDLAANVADFGVNIASLFGPLSWPFKVVDKAISVIGLVVGKIGNFSDFMTNFAEMLGDKSYSYPWNATNFDVALNRETGIKNQMYLMDLVRIFSAIDTHCMVHDEQRTDGETLQVINLMRPYLNVAADTGSAEREAAFKSVRLNRLLQAVGAPADWRAVLRSAITQ